MKSANEVIVVGGGGQAANVLGILNAMNVSVQAIYDDNEGMWGKEFMGVPILGPVASVCDSTVKSGIIAIGDCATRKKLADALDLEWINAVHPRAVIESGAHMGKGCVVDACTVIHPGAFLGDHVCVLSQCSIGHDSSILDYAFIGHGCVVAGGARVGTGAMMGIGSLVIPGKNINDWAVIGAGAVVTRDIPAGAVAFSEYAAAKVRR